MKANFGKGGLAFQKEFQELTNINFSSSFGRGNLRTNTLMSFYRSLLFICLFFIGTTVFSQEKKRVQGQVFDASNQQPLIGASVYWEDQPQQGTTTDLEGNFSLPATELPARIILSYLGYEKSIRTIQVRDLEKVQKFYLNGEGMSR